MSDPRRASRPFFRHLLKSDRRGARVARRLAWEPLEGRTLLSAMRILAVPVAAVEGRPIGGVLVATFSGGSTRA